MKRLIIVRHARATRESEFVSDMDRTLSESGLRDALVVADLIAKEVLKPELILTSPAVRAFSTALVFARKLNYDQSKIIIEKKIYEAHTVTLRNVVDSLSDKYSNVMIFGHNPGFTNLINSFIDQEINHLPTSALAVIDFPVDTWKEITSHSAKLSAFKYPPGVEVY